MCSLKYLVEVEEKYPWMKLCTWDWALDNGTKGIKACQLILKLLTFPMVNHIMYVKLEDLGGSTLLARTRIIRSLLQIFCGSLLCNRIV